MAAQDTKKAGDKKNAGEQIKVTHLRIRSHQAGFRRAGRAWPAEEVTVSIDEFDDAQVEQLLAEPMLVVVPVGEESK